MDRPVANIEFDLVSDLLGGKTVEEVLSKYSITPGQFESFKERFLSEVRVRFPSSSRDSRAVSFFKGLRNSHSCTAWFRERGIDATWYKLVSEVMKGSSRPTYGLVFALREHVAPSMWYYNEETELPKALEFTPIASAARLPDRRRELCENPSCALAYFDVLRENRKMSVFCQTSGVVYNNIKNYVYLKSHEGRTPSVVRPSFEFISKLKKRIQPDWWYVYPGEVSKDAMRELALSAERFCASH